MGKDFFVGTAEMEITPDKDLPLAGSLDPRTRRAEGVHDPLYVRAVVLESAGVKLAYVIFDLIGLSGKMMIPYIKKAALVTGIPEDNIIWACSHTHTGPVSIESVYPGNQEEVIDFEWLHHVLDKFVLCLKEASSKRIPARVSRMRGFSYGISHNRRIRFKNQNDINTWLLSNADDIQSLGSSGPVDPEIGIISFEDERETLLAVMYQFSLHANNRFGLKYSADYPGVVALRIKEKFGAKVVPLFMPGACGDINPIRSCDETGNELARVICQKLEARAPMEKAPSLGVKKQTLTIPFRNLNEDQEERLKASKWGESEQRYFRGTLAELRAEGRTEIDTAVHSWHIGDVAFSSIPGELFVEWGIRIKEKSPFPWTYPVELSGGCIGYMITQDAWEHGGYEALTAKTAPVSVEGVRAMVDRTLEDLNLLRKTLISESLFSRIEKLKNGQEITIRTFRKSDGEALAEFYLSIPKEDYFFYCPHPLDRKNALKKAGNADSPGFVCIILEADHKKIAGYAWYRWSGDADKSTVGICISRDLQGLGAGRVLMINLIEFARLYGPPIMSLTVQKSNSGAVKLYRKMGFNIIREQVRKADNEPEYYMELNLRELMKLGG